MFYLGVMIWIDKMNSITQRFHIMVVSSRYYSQYIIPIYDTINLDMISSLMIF